MVTIEIIPLDYKKSFEQLTDKEKLYTYYLNKACWAGIPISSFQISYESPALFIIFQSFFSSFENMDKIEEQILKNQNISKEDYESFLLYVIEFYSNYGNYSSFGKLKIIPKLPCEKFEEILKQSDKYESFSKIWDKIKILIYKNLSSLPKISSKFTDEDIVGTYYLNGISNDEIKKIDNILIKKNISLVNTRLLKIEENKYEVLIGSIEEKEEKLQIENENISITLKYGDFKDYLIKINSYLEKAKLYASNEIEKKLIDLYMEHFKTGDIEKHKESQRVWIKNISPVVEYNLGWIETYIDTQGVRAYYEGIVALKDKDSSIKYKILVDNAEYFLSQLPWNKDFEKDQFIVPDFTALNIVGFPTTSLFVGINLPNYLDIHDNDGFKNLSLLNAFSDNRSEFFKQMMNKKDLELENQIGIKVSMFKTALHELLGHGSGKLFKIDENDKYNFDIENVINPITKEKIKSFYLPGETYESKFSTICRTLEEGRADYIALYLVFDKKAQQIFGFKEEEYENVIYIMWFTQIIGGITGIGSYRKGIWVNPYSQERYIFLNYVFQNQEKDKEILNFDINKDNWTCQININKNNLIKYGKDLIGKMLISIHIAKCLGDVKAAEDFVNKYSLIDKYMSQIFFTIFCKMKFEKNTIQMNVDLIMEKKMRKK